MNLQNPHIQKQKVTFNHLSYNMSTQKSTVNARIWFHLHLKSTYDRSISSVRAQIIAHPSGPISLKLFQNLNFTRCLCVLVKIQWATSSAKGRSISYANGMHVVFTSALLFFFPSQTFEQYCQYWFWWVHGRSPKIQFRKWSEHCKGTSYCSAAFRPGSVGTARTHLITQVWCT